MSSTYQIVRNALPAANFLKMDVGPPPAEGHLIQLRDNAGVGVVAPRVCEGLLFPIPILYLGISSKLLPKWVDSVRSLIIYLHIAR